MCILYVCKRSTVEHGTREGNATAYTNQTVWERKLKHDGIMKMGHMLMLSGFQHTPHTSSLMKMERIICNAVQQQHISFSDPTDQ